MILTDMEKHISESAPERIRARYRSLVEAAREGDFGELDEDVVVIDTETTGISFKNDELTQIAAARLCKGWGNRCPLFRSDCPYKGDLESIKR